MKKILITLAISLLFIGSLGATASADLLPPDSHSINTCVKFVNLDKFPDVVLIGSYTGPMVKEAETYIVKNDECLTKGYKFNTLDIYWDKKESLTTNTIVPKSENILLQGVEVAGGNVDNSDPLTEELIEYSMDKNMKTAVPVVYMSKQISKFNDGKPDDIETFDSPFSKKQSSETSVITINDDEITLPTPREKGLWNDIACFFKSLFGKEC